MKKTDFFKNLKTLIASFKANENAAGETSTTNQGTKAKAETPKEQPATQPETPKEGEQPKEGEEGFGAGDNVEGSDKDDKEPDYAAIQSELQDLRQRVSILDEYTYLKERLESLVEQTNAIQAGFIEALELMEQYGELPTGEAIQTPKAGFGKQKDKQASSDEWRNAFAKLKKEAKETK